METKEIKFEGKIFQEDKEAREYIQSVETRLETKIQTINDRTKKHTIEIKEIKKLIENNGKM